jgi:transcriptional regulator with XRE-family HTH domain
MAPLLKQPVKVHPLKAALQQRGITQAIVAKALGVHIITVNWWMNGRERLSLEREIQIQALLDTEARHESQISPHPGNAGR